MQFQSQEQVLMRLVQWSERRHDVRVAILTSSRAVPNAPVDLLSDYDVILAVLDVHPYFQDRTWLSDFGQVLVVYRDPLQAYYGLDKTTYVTQYEAGLKIDFTVWPVGILQRIAATRELPPEFDVGYRVLLDKEHLTAPLSAPTFKAYIPKLPSVPEYETVVELFFHEATYVAKHLWRGDLMAAKYNLDQAMKQDNLRIMLEWLLETEHGWTFKPGPYGRRLGQWLSPDVWAELEATYVGADLEANWDAMFRTIDLFRKVAKVVGDRLGYPYPSDLDRRAVSYLGSVRNLHGGATDR